MPKIKRKFAWPIDIAIILIICIFMVITGMPEFSGRPRVWDDVEREGVLRVVSSGGRLNFYMENGEGRGFNLDLVKRFCDESGVVAAVTVENDFDEKLRGLKTGKYDVVIDLLPATTECKYEMCTSMPLLVSRPVLVQRKPSADGSGAVYVSDVSELDGKLLYIARRSYYIMTLNHLCSELGLTVEVVEVDDDVDVLLAKVSRGEVDYAVLDELCVRTEISDYLNLEAELPLGFSHLMVWGLAGGGETKKRIDEYIDTIARTQWFAERRHFYAGK